MIVKNSSWLIYRWMLPLFILLGYWLTENLFNNDSVFYLFLNVTSLLSLVLLIAMLRKLTPVTVMMAILLMVLILGYYAKFYLLSYALLNNWSYVELAGIIGYFVIGVINSDILLRAFEVTTYSFFAFSIVSSLMIYKYGSVNKRKVLSKKTNTNKTVYKIVVMASVLFIITSAVRLYYGLGSTHQSVVLPMKLGGITTIVNSQVVLYLMVMALGYSYHSNRPQLKAMIATIFLIYGVIMFLLFHSKLHLIYPLLSIVLFRMIYGTYAFSVKKILLIILAIVAIYPFLNLYRVMAVNQGQSGISTLLAAIGRGRSVGETDSVISSIALGASSLLGRVVGVDSLVVIMDARNTYVDDSMMDILFDEESITRILTLKIIGAEGTGIAEGVLGGFYFLTATDYGTVMLFSLWTLIVLLVVYRLWLKGTALSNNILIIWMIFCLQTTMGGLRVTSFLWFGFAIAMAYVLVRINEKRMVNRLEYLS